MKEEIITLLQKILGTMGVADLSPEVAIPEDAAHGDYTTNIAMRLVKVLKRPPMEIAKEIQESIIRHQKQSKLGWLDHAEIAPPGFLNLFLSQASLVSCVSSVLKEKDHYGSAQVLVKEPRLKQKIMVEFADPNPFKEFHIGHLRNITLGESFSRLLESIGHDVRRVNYQGDVGMHVSKSLWGLKKMLSEKPKLLDAANDPRTKAAVLGKAYAYGAQAFENSETDKAEIVSLNKKIYASDPSVQQDWKNGRQISLDYFDCIYERVGTKFTRFYFESEVAPTGMKIVLDHIKDGVFEESDGAVIFRGERVGLHTRVFVTKEHYATYEAKDLGLAILKHTEWKYDRSIIMTGNEQSPYFAVMLAALKLIEPTLAEKTTHIPFGMVNLSSGKMSSRTGNVVTAEWLIGEAKEKINVILEKNDAKYSKEDKEIIAEKAAIAAVKYAMLKVGAPSDIAFDLDKSIAFDGDSGPYIQYTYARAKSVLRKGQKPTAHSHQQSARQNKAVSGKLQADSLFNSQERSLARLILYFPDVVTDAARNFAPNTICTYLFQLAQTFNLFYQKHPIVGNEERLVLTAAAAQILKNGLYLLGIETLEQM